jgi:hypothetical protein
MRRTTGDENLKVTGIRDDCVGFYRGQKTDEGGPGRKTLCCFNLREEEWMSTHLSGDIKNIYVCVCMRFSQGLKAHRKILTWVLRRMGGAYEEST